jgi:hypothetical protein
MTFEFRSRSVQIGYQPFLGFAPPVSVIPEIQFAGSFASAGTSLQFDIERCDPNFNLDVPALEFTATANGLVTISAQVGLTLVVTYTRQ